jgi:hypothetical protein
VTQLNLALATLFTILLAEHPVDLTPPVTTLTPPVTTEDRIKAAREKSDLEFKLNTKRPWDGMDLTGPRALEKRQYPPVGEAR